jgi:hypothetical protein
VYGVFAFLGEDFVNTASFSPNLTRFLLIADEAASSLLQSVSTVTVRKEGFSGHECMLEDDCARLVWLSAVYPSE